MYVTNARKLTAQFMYKNNERKTECYIQQQTTTTEF